MKVKIDKNKCIGCGACAAMCPEVFDMKDGKAVVKKSEAKEACAKDAADSCPVGAITIK